MYKLYFNHLIKFYESISVFHLVKFSLPPSVRVMWAGYLGGSTPRNTTETTPPNRSHSRDLFGIGELKVISEQGLRKKERRDKDRETDRARECYVTAEIF